MGSLPPFDAPYSQPEEEKNFWGNEYVPKVRSRLRLCLCVFAIEPLDRHRACLPPCSHHRLHHTQLDHPGTMPPGTRLEDKPIAELSPVSNIPYPHFQEWPWHYRWVRVCACRCLWHNMSSPVVFAAFWLPHPPELYTHHLTTTPHTLILPLPTHSFPAYQPRRLDFIEWMTQRGLMVEDDGDTRGVRFLGRKRRFRAQKAQAEMAAASGSDPMTPDERRQALEGIDGDYWRSEGAELIDPELFIFEKAKVHRSRIPFIVKVREERAAKAAEAAAMGLTVGEAAAAAAAVSPVLPAEPAKGGRKKGAAPPPSAEI